MTDNHTAADTSPRAADDEGPDLLPVRRVMTDAATAPRVQTAAASSPFTMAATYRAGMPADADRAETRRADPPPSEPAVVPATRKPAKRPAQERAMPATTNDSPRVRVLRAIANGNASGEDIRAACTFTNMGQFYNAVHAAKKDGLLSPRSDGTYTITAEGRKLLASLDDKSGTAKAASKTAKASPKPAKPKASTKPGTKTKPAKAQHKPAHNAPHKTRATHRLRPEKLHVTEILPATRPAPALPRTFRCALYNDGGFSLQKGDSTVDLDAAETAALFAYLDRMAEPEAAAA